MSSLHICTIVFDWYPHQSRVHRLAQAGIAAGYSMDVICLLGPGEKRYEVCDGVRVYRLPIERNYGGCSLPVLLLGWCQFLFLAAILVTRLHLKHAYDVIHVHNVPDFLVFSALFPRLLGAKIILDVQDVTPELLVARSNGRQKGFMRHLAIWQERISTAFAHHVVTVGWPFEERLLQRGVAREKLTVILNSPHPAFFPATKRPLLPSETVSDANQPFILMYYGTIAERNGLDVIIRALPLALPAVPRLRLDIMGTGDHLPFLKSLARELGVSEHVVFTGHCPFEYVVDFVVHGDIGVIPYRCDGFMDMVSPTKAYEFAWMHRPMIASDTHAIRSMFRPESVAFCNPTGPESFADAIIDLYQHPEKRTHMIVHAAEDFELYRWELVAEHYTLLLASLSHKYNTQVSFE